MSSPVTGVTPEGFASGEFGANEWLVDEMYERYRVDKHSVDKSWWPILENYQPGASAPLAAEPAAESPAASPAAEAPAAATPSAETPAAPTAGNGTTPVARTTGVPAKPQPIPAEAPTTASVPVVGGADAGEQSRRRTSSRRCAA